MNNNRLLEQIRNVTSSPIFEETINNVLEYVKPFLISENPYRLLTPEHFNRSTNKSKFSNLISCLNFDQGMANRYQSLYEKNPKLVRTTSNLKLKAKNRALKKLNIFQIVVLTILFRKYLYYKANTSGTQIGAYLSSIKNGNNNSDKNIRLLYIVLVYEFYERFSNGNINMSTGRFKNKILQYYSPNFLENQLEELINEEITGDLIRAGDDLVEQTGSGKKKTTSKKKTTDKKIKKIHKGPRGGKYYITKGRKVYI